MNEIRYMISETAKQVDVEAHVLRYWEEELNLQISRNEMGHRYYTEDDITLFKNIKELKEQGFQLKAIKMILPELKKEEGYNLDKLIEKREELNEAAEKDAVVPIEKNVVHPMDQKIQQFQAIFTKIVLQAMKENNAELSKEIGEEVGNHVLKEMDYLIRMQDEREDERFKKLDETIRMTQQTRKKEKRKISLEERRLKRIQKKENKKQLKLLKKNRNEIIGT